jgi:hypothetical protein
MMLLLMSLLTAHAGVRASSELRDDTGSHSASKAFDGLFSEGWAENEDEDESKDGSWIELDLARSTRITNLAIWPGNLSRGARSFREFGRPRTLEIYVDGKLSGSPVILEDRMQRAEVKLDATGRKVRIHIKNAYSGMVYSETYIAEIAINFPAGDTRGMDRWLAGSDAKSRQKRFDKQLEAAFLKHKSEQFGDKASFAFLTDAVADGPPYARPKLSTVPLGYRAQAMPVSPRAHKALRLLLDANAVPAFELAALRATGEQQRTMHSVVSLLKAHQEMVGSSNVMIPNWGEEGWGLGALRSFGEPLPLEMDTDGNIMVADTGNNRVQRFDLNGKAEKQWGPSADMANTWFGRSRDWYVSGAKPGETTGSFMNPLDIAVIPDKKAGDSFAVLDATGRIQIFDPSGRVSISWKVSIPPRAQPKLGGEAYLLWVDRSDQLIAVMQNRAVTYTLQGEEIGQWKITDGTPRAAEVSPKGQLLFGIGDKVVQYHPEGARYGEVITSEQLGSGHEDFDLALDEDNKLWALTDAGMIVKFKKPGKVDFAVRAIDYPLKNPRIAVHDGMIYFTSQNSIKQIDARQAKMDAESAEEEE